MMGLKEFHTKTLRDPLFAAEGLDIDNALLALEQLELYTKRVGKVLAGAKFSYRLFLLRYPIEKTLHPLGFLRSFLEAERLRRRFLTVPTEENARILLRGYKRTVEALKENLDMYLGAHADIRKVDDMPPESTLYRYYQNVVTFKQVLEPLASLKENAEALEKEVASREALLEGKGAGSSAESEPVIDAIPLSEEAPPLSDALLKCAAFEEKNYPVILEKYGPISYSLPHFDGEPKTHQFFAYVIRGRESERKEFVVTLADEHYFLELSEEKYDFWGDRVQFGPLVELGHPYWYQQAVAFYSTRDLGFYVDIATLVDLQRRPALNQTAVLSQKSSLLDLLLWRGVSFEQTYEDMLKVFLNQNAMPPLYYALINRSYPSLYYLPFNRSVWRLKEKAEFLGSIVGTNTYYKTFDEVKQTLIKDERVWEEIFMGKRIRREAWQKSLRSS